ncbi:MAG: hypothetical protein ACLSAP_09595 [Oscillospiraceae bacterium]
MAPGQKPAVHGEDGTEYLSAVLIDITKTKQEQEELRLSMERHQIIMDQTNDIIFEWNIRKSKIYYSPNWVKKFGYQPIAEEIHLRIPQESHIFPEDIPSFLELMHSVSNGAPRRNRAADCQCGGAVYLVPHPVNHAV